MKQIAKFLGVILVISMVVSCQKNTNSPSSPTVVDFTGTWKFISLQASTTATIQSSAGGTVYKTVSTSNYTTTNNGGTINFSPTVATSTGIYYTINSTASSTTYINNVPSGTNSFPVNNTISPYSSTGNYTRIGSDSLYFPSGTFSNGTTGSTYPSIAKISFVDDKMIMMQKVDTTVINQGQPMLTQGTTIVTLQR